MKYSVPKRMLCWAVTASVAMGSMPMVAFAETSEETDGTPVVETSVEDEVEAEEEAVVPEVEPVEEEPVEVVIVAVEETTSEPVEEESTKEVVEETTDEATEEICEDCGRNMVVKYGPHGKFLACPGFPDCKNTKPYYEKIGQECPKCGKEIVIKRTKKGRKYYGCIDNPNCDFMSWNKPEKEEK